MLSQCRRHRLLRGPGRRGTRARRAVGPPHGPDVRRRGLLRAAEPPTARPQTLYTADLLTGGYASHPVNALVFADRQPEYAGRQDNSSGHFRQRHTPVNTAAHGEHHPAQASGPADVLPIGAVRRVGYLITLVIAPLVVVVAAVPVAWWYRWGPSWLDIALGAVLYGIAIFGITAGYHRCFTHRAFVARGPLKVALALAGGIALEGPATLWAAEHRRHHRYSDGPG